MKKKYQLFLCEDYYEEDSFKERRVCEIASRDAKTLGQAYNIEFYTKIDGTHELSFELPRYYFDSETGKRITNPLVELVVNKSKIEVLIEDKTYFITINRREDREEGNVFSYSYGGTDSYIEELSKTGYGLTFSNEVEGNGLGTIHQLAAEVANGTDWVYEKDKTGTLYEYTTELSYNVEQDRYDNVYIPVPVHPVRYITELSRYCYELDLMRKDSDNKYHKIYCYDDTEQVVATSVENLIYNADEFVDAIGWQSYSKKDGEVTDGLLVETIAITKGSETTYCMKVVKSPTGLKRGYLLNETAADANKNISASNPYAFRFVTGQGSKGKIKGIYLYNKNPLTYPNEKAEYILTKDFLANIYYTIKTRTSFYKPYLVLDIDCSAGDFILEKIELFEVKGKETKDADGNVIVTAETNNLRLIGELTNGSVISSEYQNIMQFPENTIDAYTHKYVQYFIRENYEINSQGVEHQINSQIDDAVLYLNFEEDVNTNENYVFSSWVNGGSPQSFTPLTIISVDKLPDSGNGNIYKLSTNNKYYQYYTIVREGVIGSKWDYALYGDGANDKRRTLSVERSNRFNIIQELAELFKVWPVFNVYRDEETGQLHKSFWFKESCIKENFSGFHRGVNLLGLSRDTQSDEVVTKMYVEDVESDFSEDGFVSIRKAELNPWGENYYYNFQYYVNQKLLNTKFDSNTLLIDYDLKNLYSGVKAYNDKIFALNDKIATSKVELSNLNAKLTTLAVSIASLAERVAALNADLEGYREEMGATEAPKLPDYKNTQSNIKNYAAQRKKYKNEQKKVETQYKTLKKEQDANLQMVSTFQKEKEALIEAFETKYAQYIKEGVWNDSSYVDNNTYFLDSQKVMNTSSVPKSDWTISVLDGSVVKELEDFKVEVGDKTFLVDNEFFGVKKNTEENYVFEVLISGIKDCLDNPKNNEIEVRNYLTSFEDLFQRISAATQSLELNEQTYDRAAYFSADGQVDKDILQNTLLQNALILANATDNSYSLDSSGLYLQSVINPAKKMRAIADGVFLANSFDLNGEPKWQTGITADGINASLLTAGEINTSVIKIFSNGQPNFSWNKLGITAYKLVPYKENEVLKHNVDSGSFTRLDYYGLYTVSGKDTVFNLDANGEPWFNGKDYDSALDTILNNSLVSITNRGFNLNVKGTNGSIRLGYESTENTNLYGLYIKDVNGNAVVKLQNNGVNSIAGWNITPTYFYTDSGKKTFRIVSAANTDKNWIFAKDKDGNMTFNVDKDGILHATGAKIDGEISVGNGGRIGGFTINGNKLKSDKVGLAGNHTWAFWAGSDTESTAPFRVKKDGSFYASKGHISGSLTIGDTRITGDSLARLYNAAVYGKSGDSIRYIYGIGGTVGGWNISNGNLSSKGVNLNSAKPEIMLDEENGYAMSLGFFNSQSFQFFIDGTYTDTKILDQIPYICFRSLHHDNYRSDNYIFAYNGSLYNGIVFRDSSNAYNIKIGR